MNLDLHNAYQLSIRFAKQHTDYSLGLLREISATVLKIQEAAITPHWELLILQKATLERSMAAPVRRESLVSITQK